MDMVASLGSEVNAPKLSLNRKDVHGKQAENFVEKGLTEADALVNARLARILTADDYDFDKKQPKLWSPASDYKVNSGARSKVTAA